MHPVAIPPAEGFSPSATREAETSARAFPRTAAASAIPPLRSVIAYENPAAGLHALRRLKILLGRFLPDVELQLAVWPLAHLGDSEWSDTVVTDLAAADLLILATRGPEAWPKAGDAWLTTAVAAREAHALTVMAFPGLEEPWILTLESPPPAAAAKPSAVPAPFRRRAA